MRFFSPLKGKCHSRLSWQPLALHSAAFSSWQSQHSCVCAYLNPGLCVRHDALILYDVCPYVCVLIPGGGFCEVNGEGHVAEQPLRSCVSPRGTSAQQMLVVTQTRIWTLQYRHCDVAYVPPRSVQASSFAPPPAPLQSFHIDSSACPMVTLPRRAAADRDKTRVYFPTEQFSAERQLTSRRRDKENCQVERNRGHC